MASKDAEWAEARWLERYPVFQGKPAPWLKVDWIALEKSVKSLTFLFRGAWTIYLKTNKDFYAGHPPKKFFSNMGEFAVQAERAADTPLLDSNAEAEQSNWGGMNDAELAEFRQNEWKIRQDAEKRAQAAEERKERTRLALLNSPKVDPQVAREAIKKLKGEM